MTSIGWKRTTEAVNAYLIKNGNGRRRNEKKKKKKKKKKKGKKKVTLTEQEGLTGRNSMGV